MSMRNYRILDCVDRPRYVGVQVEKGGRSSFTRTLRRGLYRFRVVADASEFDWEGLYIILNEFGNRNVRTGPWDFDLTRKNIPLVPAYRVYLNERRIGLWMFQRPSCTNIEEMTLEGEFGLLIEKEEKYTIRLEPYNAPKIYWNEVLFEIDTDDQLQPPFADGLATLERNWFWQYREQSAWVELQRKLETFGAFLAAPLAQSLAAGSAASSTPIIAGYEAKKTTELDIPILIADYRLNANRESLAATRILLENLLARPAWGNPEEDGYGHNGDMAAAYSICAAVQAYNWLYDDIGDLREKLLSRLERQMDIFLEQAVLNRGYWGGSILQDHGMVSNTLFGFSAYGMLGHSARAPVWLSFAVPRIRRTLDALPSDGVVPHSSHHALHAYMESLSCYRQAHLYATGEDIFESARIQVIPEAIRATLHEPSMRYLRTCCAAELQPLLYSGPFLAQLACDYQDAGALRLLRLIARHNRFDAHNHPRRLFSRYLGPLYSLMVLDERVETVAEPEPLETRLVLFADSGFALYRNMERDIMFGIACGPPVSHNSYFRARGPCDRLRGPAVSGTFTLVARGKKLIHQAPGGYRARSALGNVLLIDGKGQRYDKGLPMGEMAALWDGEDIESVRYDPRTGIGQVVLNLLPAYGKEHRLSRYQRRFQFRSNGDILLQDILVSEALHEYTWLFHTFASNAITGEGDVYTFAGEDAEVRITFLNPNEKLVSRAAETDIVWSYSMRAGKRCSNVAYRMPAEAGLTVAEFLLQVEYRS